LNQVTEEDIQHYYRHISTPIIVASKEEHKNMLRKHRSKWYQCLMDDSDSEDEFSLMERDTLTANLQNLDFNSNTNFYNNLEKEKEKIKDENFNINNDNGDNNKIIHQLISSPHGISLKERQQLKTDKLRERIAKMMELTPFQSRIWSIQTVDETHHQNVPHL
jgi:hypothetical protein